MKNLAITLLTLSVVALSAVLVDVRVPVAPHHGDNLQVSARATTVTGNSLRLGTWNIQGGKGLTGSTPRAETARVIDGTADLVGLNEIRTGEFSRGNQAGELAGLLDMSWLFASTAHRYVLQELGNGVLSRVPVTRFEVVPLVHTAVTDGEVLTGRSHRNMIKLTVPLGMSSASPTCSMGRSSR